VLVQTGFLDGLKRAGDSDHPEIVGHRGALSNGVERPGKRHETAKDAKSAKKERTSADFVDHTDSRFWLRVWDSEFPRPGRGRAFDTPHPQG